MVKLIRPLHPRTAPGLAPGRVMMVGGGIRVKSERDGTMRELATKMTMQKSKTWCPRCDQGWVVNAVVRHDSTPIWICEECDATWLAAEAIGNKVWTDFSEYMKGKALPGTWDQLERKETGSKIE